MNRNLLTAGGLSALVLLSAGLAVAQPGAGRPDRNADITRAELVSKLDTRFARLDANGDGILSAADREKSIEARFKRLDADGNGAITLAEMKAGDARRGEALAARGGDAPGVAGRHRGRHGHGRTGFGPGGMGGKADANGDGNVSKAEFEARALAGFDRADADRNGVLTAAERQQAHGATRGRPKG